MIHEWKKHQFLNENWVLRDCIWRSMKHAILTLQKFQKSTKFEYEIKVQALKDTSWMKPRYLARFFCANSIKQPQLFWTNRRLLFCLTVWKKWVVFRIAGWMKNRWCRKWICCSNHILLKLNSVCSYIKRKWVSLNVQWSSG